MTHTDPPRLGYTAWVDESMRTYVVGGEPFYLLAAAIAAPDDCDLIREQLRTLRVGAETKLHWRGEDDNRRTKIAAAVAEFDVLHTVVVGAPMNPRKQERARVQCLELLLLELAGLGVDQVYLEKRTKSLDAKDLGTIDRLRGRRLIPTELRIDMAQPSVDPMLWVPDAVCGAYGDHLCGRPDWFTTLESKVTVVSITLR